MINYNFTAVLWLNQGDSAWHFVTLPQSVSEEIKSLYSTLSKGWGSLRVEVTVMNKVWKTSIFFDSKLNRYLLPIKSEIRNALKIKVEDEIEIVLHVQI